MIKVIESRVRRWHLWFIVGMLALGTIFEYPQQLPIIGPDAPSSLLGLERHAIERVFFLLPTTYAAVVFGIRGGLIAVLVALAAMLPRIIWISKYPADAALETGGVVAMSILIGLWLESYQRERRQCDQVIQRREGERERAEEALRETDQRYRSLFDRSLDAVYVHDLEGRFLDANDAALGLLGYPRDEIPKLSFADLLDDSQLRAALAAAAETIKTGTQPRPTTFKLKRKDGTFVEVETLAAAVCEGGRPVAVQGIARDLSERKRAEKALREQARRDPLTGILNHAAIVEELRGLISDGGDGASHAVAMVDVNGLKALNDTYGHQVGGAVLVAVASALPREGAIVGRYGGDEFVAVLPGADRAAAERYRDAVLDAMAGAGLTDPENGASVPLAVSIGLVIYPTETGRIEELIKLADSDMYAAKRERPVRPAGRTLPQPLGSEQAAKMVGELVPLLTSPGDLNEKLRLVAHRLMVGAGYDGVDFLLAGPRRDAPATRSALARAPDELVEAWNSEDRYTVSDHPLGATLERIRRPVILADPQHEERLTDKERGLLRAAGLRSALVAPMIWQDELIGSLSVASKREAAFAPSDAEFLMTVATQVTAIVRMATLIEELESASARLSEAHTETVMLLAAAEAHDRTTGLHLQGVRAITEALACELGYSEEEARELGLAAVLHDIGKVRVPNSVLASTGRLAEEEWALLKHHTAWGGQFLSGRPGFELAATIARSHHEHWDGGGYPDGLAGEAIPEAAAIVSAADAFDAMTTGRPYRAARSVAQAVREIVACSGRQFSPRVVEALVKLHKRKALPRPQRHILTEEAA